MYLEDITYAVKLDFSELEYADPDAFFTENCIVLCHGYFKPNQSMAVTRMEHPPMHFNKNLRFKLHEQDYFGAYSKLLFSTQKKLEAKFNKGKL